MKNPNAHSLLIKCLTWMFLVSFLTCAPPALSKEKKRKVPAKDKSVEKPLEDPLHVTSDKMVASKDGATVEFIGNVRATREEDEILAQSIKIYLYPENEKNSGNPDNVKKIVANGDVEYTAGQRKAFADRAVYTTEDQVLVLTGKKARLLTGKSWITGKKITLFRQNGRAMVESDGKNRVEAFFNPEDKSAVQ